MSSETVFIGVVAATGRQPVILAILDAHRDVIQLDQLTVDDALASINGYDSAVCAIAAPSGVNKLFLAEPDYRQRLGLRPKRSNYSTYRVAEYELRRRKISVTSTPPSREQGRKWMQVGWSLYAGLRESGFVNFPNDGARRVLEVHPHASYVTLLKQRPYPKSSLEGLLQRQLLLYERDLNVPDPMRIFEDWTRHHLLRGQLDMSEVYPARPLDALISAYTAFRVKNRPEMTCTVGDPSEGLIVLPVKELLDLYS